jgi:rhodanese-related sulfurtransferase
MPPPLNAIDLETSPEEILRTAQATGKALGVTYRGVVTPQQAWQLWQRHPAARLVDVRTAAEWELVGRIPGAIEIQYKHHPQWTVNPNFLAEVQATVPKDALVLLICRSGHRSHEAANLLAQAGYANAFNVLEGFEGDKNTEGHRGIAAGWKAHGLPWTQ